MIPPSYIPQDIKYGAYDILQKVQDEQNQTGGNFIKDLYRSLKKYYSGVEESAKTARKQGEYEECATLYVLVAELLHMVSNLSKDMDIVNMAKSSEKIWRTRADDIFETLIGSYSSKAFSLDESAQHTISSDYKNKASSLSYEIRKGMIVDSVRQTLLEAVQPSARKFAIREQGEIPNSPYEDRSTDVNRMPSAASSISEDQSKVSPREIKIANTFKPSSEKGWYDWEVYLDIDPEVAGKIKSVTYTLNPTYTESVRTINHDPNGRYALHDTGWGEFQISADIRLNNDDIITKYHWLDLGSRSGRQQGNRA